MRAPKRTRDSARRLRRVMTLPEILLWQALRGEQLAELRFRRQHPLGAYVLDFYCAAARLAVEVDGIAHDHPVVAARDHRRDVWLTEQGIRVMRFPAPLILDRRSFSDVLETILAAASPVDLLEEAQ